MSVLDPTDTFVRRHVGPSDDDVAEMLRVLGYDSLEALADATIPASIRTKTLSLTPLPGRSAGSNPKGTEKSGDSPTSNVPDHPAGVTPTTVNATLLSTAVRPRTSGSSPKRRSQYP